MGQHEAATAGIAEIPVPLNEPEAEGVLFACLELLPTGRFWTKPVLIGSNEDEIRAAVTSEIDEKRGRELYIAIKLSCANLIETVPLGRC